MLIVLTDDRHDAALVRRVLDAAVFKLGADAPDAFRHPLIAVIGEHSTASDNTTVAAPVDLGDDRPVTFTEAARAAGVSRATIGRRVADGRLVKVGRRITAASLRDWLAGRT